MTHFRYEHGSAELEDARAGPARMWTARAVPVRRTSDPPRWAVVAAHLAALTPLPSAVWRMTLALGFTAGYTEQGYVAADLTGWGAVYVVVISLLTEGAALLTLGLVRPWGEVVPSWMPVLGERRIPPLAAVLPAGIGVMVLALLWTPMVFWWQIPHDDMTGPGATIVGSLYLPLAAWGPLLAAVAVSYQSRRRAESVG